MIGRLIALLVLMGAGAHGPAAAQDALNRGKTPAQLFASDCADCHRNPRALKRNDPATLSRFLRVHYTASRESAAALAAYLISLGPDPRGARPGSGQRRPAGQAAQPAAKASAAPAAKPPEPAPEKPAEMPSAGSGAAAAPATPQAAPADPQ